MCKLHAVAPAQNRFLSHQHDKEIILKETLFQGLLYKSLILFYNFSKPVDSPLFQGSSWFLFLLLRWPPMSPDILLPCKSVRTRRKRKITEKLKTVYLLKLLAGIYIWVRKSGQVKPMTQSGESFAWEYQTTLRPTVLWIRTLMEGTDEKCQKWYTTGVGKLHPLPPKEYTPSSESNEEWVVCYGVGKETKEALVWVFMLFQWSHNRTVSLPKACPE